MDEFKKSPSETESSKKKVLTSLPKLPWLIGNDGEPVLLDEEDDDNRTQVSDFFDLERIDFELAQRKEKSGGKNGNRT